MILLVSIIDTANTDDISAFLTSAFISHTYRVESTRAIVETWEKIRNDIQLSSNLDFVSAFLAIGRFMDLKNEIEEPRFLPLINELITTIIDDLKKRGHAADIHEFNFLTAMITSACISRTEKIETINEIITHWETINNKLTVKDDIDLIAGILTIGRIYEYKYTINNIEQVELVFNKLKEIIKESIKKRKIKQNDIASAFITSAYLEITPKVEKIQDMVATWQQFQKDLKIKDNIDYVSTILAYGRLRDLDAQFFITDNTISDIIDNIRKQIELNK